jgi:general L-amino acid transport system permease protein
MIEWLSKPRGRQAAIQAGLVVIAVAISWALVNNAAQNLQSQNIASGFGFLDNSAGFQISQALIEYKESSSYARALLVGFYNTIFVAVVGIFVATIIGFGVGVARLSGNWLVARMADAYVEILRNVPLLLQLFLIYFGVLRALPAPKLGIEFTGGILLNNRGLFLPSIEAPLMPLAFAIIVGASLAAAYWVYAARRSRPLPQLWPTLAIIFGAVVIGGLFAWPYATIEYPVLKGFNVVGGWAWSPEFMALLGALTLYTASYIAEIVRAGIESVPRGQIESARALGLSEVQILRFIILPLALRVIIPPLTSQYLNLTKNSSLGVFIAYPELVSVAGITLNQTGQAIEVLALAMIVYLTLSILTSIGMNFYNSRQAAIEA